MSIRSVSPDSIARQYAPQSALDWIPIASGENFAFHPYGRKMTVENSSSSAILAYLFVDEGVPVLMIATEGERSVRHSYELKDQNILINESWLKHHSL